MATDLNIDHYSNVEDHPLVEGIDVNFGGGHVRLYLVQQDKTGGVSIRSIRSSPDWILTFCKEANNHRPSVGNVTFSYNVSVNEGDFRNKLTNFAGNNVPSGGWLSSMTKTNSWIDISYTTGSTKGKYIYCTPGQVRNALKNNFKNFYYDNKTSNRVPVCTNNDDAIYHMPYDRGNWEYSGTIGRKDGEWGSRSWWWDQRYQNSDRTVFNFDKITRMTSWSWDGDGGEMKASCHIKPWGVVVFNVSEEYNFNAGVLSGDSYWYTFNQYPTNQPTLFIINILDNGSWWTIGKDDGTWNVFLSFNGGYYLTLAQNGRELPNKGSRYYSGGN